MTQQKNKTRIVIVGGGVGGLHIASHLGRHKLAEVILIDNDYAHVWKPILHTFAAGTNDVDQQQLYYVAGAKRRNFVYVPGKMSGLDRAKKVVILDPFESEKGEVLLEKREVPYDLLVIAIGSQCNDFNTPGVKENCFFIDSRIQAVNFNDILRKKIIDSFAQKKPTKIVIVGGGATGVELAAELVQLSDITKGYGIDDFKSLFNVTLLEGSPSILAVFPPDLALTVQHNLEKLGITVQTSAKVVSAEEGGFRLDDNTLVEADIKVWAAGIKAADFLQGLDGLETNKKNQLLITPELLTTKDNSIFAIGDCSSLTFEGEKLPLAPTAQVARQQALYLIKVIPEYIDNKKIPYFLYKDRGTIVALGEYNAYGSLGKFGIFKQGIIKGRLALWGHKMLYRDHQVEINGFWIGNLLWLIDVVNGFLRPKIKLG